MNDAQGNRIERDLAQGEADALPNGHHGPVKEEHQFNRWEVQGTRLCHPAVDEGGVISPHLERKEVAVPPPLSSLFHIKGETLLQSLASRRQATVALYGALKVIDNGKIMQITER